MPSEARGSSPVGLQVLAAGEIFVEIVTGTVSRLPNPGEEVFCDAFAISLGGSITIAESAAHWGATAGVLADVAAIGWGRLLRSRCEERAIAILGGRRTAATSMTVVLNSGTDRSFISYTPPEALPDRITTRCHQIRSARPSWLYVRSSLEAESLLQTAREVGANTVLDVDGESAVCRERVARELQYADLFVPNEEELRRFTGESDLDGGLRVVRTVFGGPVVIKLGSRGAAASASGCDVLMVGGRSEARPCLDATGAGDSFVGALLAGLLAGRSLPQAVEWGNEAGYLATTRLGAVGPLSFDVISRDPNHFLDDERVDP